MTWGGSNLGRSQQIEQAQKEIRALCKCKTEEDRAKLMRRKNIMYEDSMAAERANKGGRLPTVEVDARGASSLARII